MDNARAFLGKRVTVDGELILAYADKSGHDPLEVGRMFGAKLVIERPTCTLEWHTKVMGYKCSACGKITRSAQGGHLGFCPQCGATNIGR